MRLGVLNFKYILEEQNLFKEEKLEKKMRKVNLVLLFFGIISAVISTGSVYAIECGSVPCCWF